MTQKYVIHNVEKWVHRIPGLWFKSPDFSEDDMATLTRFVFEVRRRGGHERGWVLNGARNAHQKFKVKTASRAWLCTAVDYEGKIGCDDFWEEVANTVAHNAPTWNVPDPLDPGEKLAPDIKTIRNMINVRDHKKLLLDIEPVK